MVRLGVRSPCDPSSVASTRQLNNHRNLVINEECPVTIDICPSSSRSCHGTRRYFELSKSATCLTSFWMTDRHKLNDNNSTIGFLECTQFVSSGIDRGARRACIAYHHNQTTNSYYLGWVHSIMFADALNTTEDVLRV